MSPKALPGPPATPEQRADAVTVLDAAPKAMSNVRSAAAKWQVGLAGLSALTAVFGLVKARDDVSSLTTTAAKVYGVALALGFASSLAAGLLAMKAAYGLPVITKTEESHLRASEMAGAVAAANNLRRAIGLTVVAFAFLAIAVGVAWYGPQSDGPSISVHTSTGTYCGSVDMVSSGVLRLKTDGGAVAVRLDEADQMKAVSSCSGS